MRHPVDTDDGGPQAFHVPKTSSDLRGCGVVHGVHSPYDYHEMNLSEHDLSSAVWMTNERTPT